MKKISLPVYECDKCGACCRSLIIEVAHLDVLREPRIAQECTLLDGHGKIPFEDASWNMAAKGGKTLACAFIGDDNLCGIYATRPSVCVNVVAGGESCQNARKWAKLPPLKPTRMTKTPTVLERIEDLAREGGDE